MQTNRSLLPWATWVFCLGMWGCEGSGAQQPDAGSDAGSEAGIDAGQDAGLEDANAPETTPEAGPTVDGGGASDAGADPVGWTPLPGLPDGCVVERAEHPELLFDPEWVPCGDGCQRLVEPDDYQRAFSSRMDYHDGEVGYLAIAQRAWDDPQARRMLVLANTNGDVFGAWRGHASSAPGVCSAGFVSAGDGAAALVVRISGDQWPRSERIYHAPLSDIGIVTEPLAILDETDLAGSNAIQHLAVSSTTVAAEVQLEGVVWVFEDSERRKLADGDSAVQGTPQAVQVVGRNVFWEDWGARNRLAYGAVHRDAAIYLEDSEADVMWTSVTENRLVWQEGYDYSAGSGWQRGELWIVFYLDFFEVL